MKRVTLFCCAVPVLLFGVAQAAPVQWSVADGGNDHWYDVIDATLTWEEAADAAAALLHEGMTGHLATVTSQAENDFLAANFPSIAGDPVDPGPWIGGFQPAGSPEPNGNWHWITGEPFSYTNWDVNEPSNAYWGGPHGDIPMGSSEERLEFHGNPRWNDLPAAAVDFGYVVEYAPPARVEVDLLVSSFSNHRIVRYDGTTGTLEGVFDEGFPLDQPGWMTMGPTRSPDFASLYVSNGDLNVLRYDAQTGTFLGVFVAPGYGGLSYPGGLAFGPDQDLYIASTDINQILNYDGTTGEFLDVFVDGGALDSPREIVFGPDGHLYVANGGSDEILRYNGATGALIDSFASDGGLDIPNGLTFGPDGNLYVSSSGTDQVLRYNGITGEFIDIFTDGGGLDEPVGLEFGPDGHLYVVSQLTQSVLRYDGTTGAYMDVFASGELSNPIDLAFLVPEPGPLTLLLCGALGLLAYRGLKRGHS